jgi:hypothetical protein
VEAAEEGLLLGESAEYTASQAHLPTPVPTTHPSIPPCNPSKAQIFTKDHLPRDEQGQQHHHLKTTMCLLSTLRQVSPTSPLTSE